VEQFVSESLADVTYSQCLLLFLRQQYAVDYRKVIWAELQDDFQALATLAPLDLHGMYITWRHGSLMIDVIMPLICLYVM
jgi:hypothetical protein